MKNIMTVVPINPIKHVCQEKYLKAGLKSREKNWFQKNACLDLNHCNTYRKLGADAKSSPKHARLTDPQESRNNTELN